jgi:hypothetical protein
VTGIIAVDEGEGYVTWTEVDDFNSHGPNDKVYTLDHATGLVAFGDGTHGKIPRWLSGNGSNRDDADLVNIKATSYRWGGGTAGNTGAGTITGLRAAITFVTGVTNAGPVLWRLRRGNHRRRAGAGAHGVAHRQSRRHPGGFRLSCDRDAGRADRSCQGLPAAQPEFPHVALRAPKA